MPRSLDGLRQCALMFGAGTSFSARANFSGVLNQPFQDVCLLVVNNLAGVRAELTGTGSSPERSTGASPTSRLS